MKLIKPVPINSKDKKYVLIIKAKKMMMNEQNETISSISSKLYNSKKTKKLWIPHQVRDDIFYKSIEATKIE